MHLSMLTCQASAQARIPSSGGHTMMDPCLLCQATHTQVCFPGGEPCQVSKVRCLEEATRRIRSLPSGPHGGGRGMKS